MSDISSDNEVGTEDGDFEIDKDDHVEKHKSKSATWSWLVPRLANVSHVLFP
jgi:hypothetical protein